MTPTSKIRVRGKDGTVREIDICWPPEKAEQVSAHYPDGIVDAKLEAPSDVSTPAERKYFARLLASLGLR